MFSVNNAVMAIGVLILLALSSCAIELQHDRTRIHVKVEDYHDIV